MERVIKKPEIDEIDECSKLIYTSGEELYSYIFALEPQQLIKFLSYLIGKKTIYSLDNIVAEYENGKIRGACVGYPAKDMKKFTLNMLIGVLGMLKIVGFKTLMTILSRLEINSYFPKLYNNEYFISNIAVSNEYRGEGIGRELLHAAEEEAKKLKLDAVSLFVEIDNHNAKQFYNKLSYRQVDEKKLPEKYHKYGIVGFNKMVKELK